MHIGTIIKRPLNYPLISKLEFHYGIVIGTTAKGDVVILDMTSEHDIAFRELNDFMAGFSLSTLEVHCHCRTVTLSMIIERLQPVQYEVYDLVDFNCRDFAELIVLSIQPQKRSKPINEFRLILNNIAIAGTELMLSNPNNESVKGILINHLGNLKFNRIRLQDSLSD